MEKLIRMRAPLLPWLKANAGLLLLLAITFGIYALGFHGELVVDDVQILKDNPRIEHGDIARFFSSGFWENVQQGSSTAMYRPLILVYFWLLHTLWGVDPTGYHVVLTLLHLANICLVYAVARRVFSTSAMAATIGAALFALNPTRAESVAWISGVPDPLVTFFLLGALLAHHAFSKSGNKWGYLALAAILFQSALWCKEVAVVFPLVVAAIDWLLKRKINWPSILLYTALVAGYFVARKFALGATDQTLGNLHITQISRASDLALGYCAWLIFPTQVPFYLQPPQHPVATPLGWFAAALMVCALCLAWKFGADRKALLASALVWAIGFSWTALLMMFYLEGYYSARFLYVPATGMAFFSALFFDRMIELRAGWKIPASALCAALAAAYAVVTLQEIPAWHDEVAVYRRMTKLQPEGTVGFMNFGFKLMDDGDYAQAEDNFQTALRNARIPRVRAEALVALGTVTGMRNDLSRSESYLNEAAQVDPKNPLVWSGLGNLAWLKGQPYEAIPLYEKSLAMRPQNYEAAMNLASVYEQTGQTERAASIRNAYRKP
jgi:Tfp pilus assembly protein PilF